jgi:PAS domain-containing protein
MESKSEEERSNSKNNETIQNWREIIDSVEGGVMIFSVSPQDQSVQLVDCSRGVQTLMQRDMKQLREMTEEKMFEHIVFEDDRKGALRVFYNVAKTGIPDTAVCRISLPNHSLMWIGGEMSRVMTEDGKILIVSALQKLVSDTELYRGILDTSESMIQVCDRNTHEIYFANSAAIQFAGNPDHDFTEKKCYEYFMHRKSPCEFCNFKNSKPGVEEVKESTLDCGRTLRMKGRSLFWHDKEVIIEFADDVTASKEFEDAY